LDAYQRMRRELDQLKSDGRSKVADRLARAREHGDIRENADYDAAKNEQGLMEARIRDLERMLRDVDIIESVESDSVAPGQLVTIRMLDEEEGEDETYLLALSAEERAPGVRTITSSSPLGSALLGCGIGDRVTYDAPGGVFTYEVVAFEPYRPS
jgi:transcription elongation factor GreA